MIELSNIDSKKSFSVTMKVLLVFIIMIVFPVFSQKEKPQNYRRFDEKLVHFGFMLGANNANFNVVLKPDAYSTYGLKSLVAKSSIGGQVGIVSTLRLGTPVVRLRMIPTLSFQERVMTYNFEDLSPTAKGDRVNVERINSTNIDIPLMFQFRTLRVNNFAAYALFGAQYTIDLQSQENASQDFNDPFLKIRQHDYQGQVGVGIELFAPFFKFGMEVKYSHGFVNTFVPENTFIANPIDKMYNRSWWFSIIFEG